MRWVIVSVVVHVLALVWLMPARDAAPRTPSRAQAVTPTTEPTPTAEPTPIVVEMVMAAAPGAPAGGGAGAREAARPRRTMSARSRDAWADLAIRDDRVERRPGDGSGPGDGTGRGDGSGRGDGTGRGIGFGDGGAVPPAVRDIPPPPVPVEAAPSKARPARLVWPTRDEEVEDEAELFVARITVDEDGTVVGARMIKTRPGARGDDAASAIWRFRYLPALDDRGTPIRSTFEQPFQVR